jgi:hypothetical protein
VDRAEILALTAEVAGDWLREDAPSGGPRDGLVRATFRADLLQAALALSGPRGESRALDDDLIRLIRAARLPAGGDPETDLPDLALPPPLRDVPTAWLEDPPPATPGLVPSAHDLRWTRRARAPAADGEEYRSILLRLRVVLDERGEPVLLPSPSEAWELRAGPSGDAPLEARVWRFDRAAWLSGEDPWTVLDGDAPLEVRDPESPSGRRIRGTVESVCAGCHEDRDDLRPLLRPDRAALGPFLPVADAGRREAERLRVRGVLPRPARRT